MNKKRVLIGSPVYQKPEILKLFLESLKQLKQNTITIDYIFIDDNVDKLSSQLLTKFFNKTSKITIIHGKENGIYNCNEESHFWNDNLIFKVAKYKNIIIDYAIKNNYDYLFLVDSDLILHPTLIEHLKSMDKEIISEVFWSDWHNDNILFPNVWLFDEFDLVPKKLGEKLTEKEMIIRQTKFLNQLKIPGIYEVGGLGACTLISRNALLKGVNFEPIKNLTIWGEDRFFCIRALVLGLRLFVDTFYPAYHIYRESEIDGVSEYVKKNESDISFKRNYKVSKNKITLSMIVKNEEKRYLVQVLKTLKDHIDEAVIIDDASTDNTYNICKEILKDIPLHIFKNDVSMFKNESELRKKQWEETIKTNPDWILNLDSDEIIEESFFNNLQILINDQLIDLYSFRLYDMWDEKSYREDKYWNAHNTYRPFLLRYQPKFNYCWNESAQHCGRFPMNIFKLKNLDIHFKIKHLGWSCLKDREEKFKRYQALDQDAIFGVKKQYDSILDESPNLIKWEECENV